MHRRLAAVIPNDLAPGHRLRRHVTPIANVDARAGFAGPDVRRQSASAEDGAGEVRVEVEVEGVVGAAAQGGFQGVHVRARGDGPGVVGGVGRAEEGEADVVGVVGFVEGGELVGHHGRGHGGGVACFGQDVEVGGDFDGFGLAREEARGLREGACR